MGILKKILYGILAFFILCCGVIVLCAVKPEMSTQIAETLKLNENDEYSMSPIPGRRSDQNGSEDIMDEAYPESGALTNAIWSEEPEGSGQSEYGNPTLNMPVSDTGIQDAETQSGEDLQADPGTYGIIAPASVVVGAAISPFRKKAAR